MVELRHTRAQDLNMRHASIEADKLLIGCANDIIITDSGIVIELELKGDKLEVEFRHDSYCRLAWEKIVDLAIERTKEIQDYQLSKLAKEQ